MATVETRYEHILLDDRKSPIIAGTTMKVIELVREAQANGWNIAGLHAEHPYLTLGQIHSALAYYWDHQVQLDQEMERRERLVEELRAANPPSPLVERLRNQGLT